MTRTETLRTAAHQCIRDATDDSKDEKIEKPAKAWRNWYRALRTFVSLEGDNLKKGERYPGALVWPSKDAAESCANEQLLAGPRFATGCGWAEYLGAFPEGERP